MTAGSMTIFKTLGLTTLAMIAFAGNSLLCRVALKETAIDPASFTSIRLASGALILWLLVRTRYKDRQGGGNWLSSMMLFTYAAGFSFAYVSLTAGTGALLLFGAVQITMISYGMWTGERLKAWQWLGLLLAFAGLVGLLLPGLSAPPLMGSLLMLGAGIAWGVYSLRGHGGGDATRVTAGNFIRAVPVTLALSALTLKSANLDLTGAGYAMASGALASGLGYAIWYTVLPSLKSTSAASVQLSVPVIAAIGGIIFLGEAMSLRLLLTSIAILGGVALVIAQNRK